LKRRILYWKGFIELSFLPSSSYRLLFLCVKNYLRCYEQTSGLVFNAKKQKTVRRKEEFGNNQFKALYVAYLNFMSRCEILEADLSNSEDFSAYKIDNLEKLKEFIEDFQKFKSPQENN
jgi:hypothetical protein